MAYTNVISCESAGVSASVTDIRNGMMANMAGKPGRPSKGPRAAFLTRMHPELKAALHEAAVERGLTANDLIALLVAEHTGQTHLIDIQEVLPLQKTA